ncbi:uncharacterized protein B0T15DRAFT_300810 [Chaetomium strumarium]|uniref:ADF-H domain-containing protein n=1 Tax=Chaetomium strumarium TaxID=1170767 RepID=A0AAJ0LYG5_9PEZI|nr:hypothetical protein B0T15DRAFT_300810 [Chaetomium strumarium]
MSLNGLDDARVKEAHEAAVAEPGGWLLLKYATRDEVELLGRGNGGIVEIRNNISQYEEKSPLYGFLRYRRRNVIIKYLPEDCSRLIQARVTVHFDAVCDRFSPYDTTFSIADSKELKDTKLSAACSLHAASGSTSSSTSSLRRRRLMEIAEEEEEEERERKRQSIVREEEGPRSPTVSAAEPPVTLNADLARLPEAARFAGELDPPSFTGVPRPSSPTKSFDENGGRMSSQSSRTDLYLTTSYPYSKPRVKVGPRPSADLAGRPRSSAGGAAHRPVSTVPAGLKSFSKGSRKARSHSQSQDEEAPESPIKEQAEDRLQAAIAADTDSKVVDNESAEPSTNSDAQAAVTATAALKVNPPVAAAPPNKQSTMTPEKARLLKAMKLREKKKLMSLQSTLDVPASETPSAPSTPGLPEEMQEAETAENAGLVEEASRDNDGQPDDPATAFKADSGVDVGTDHTSVDTHTDSQPASPLATSETGDSTQASSLSESTDETALGRHQPSAWEGGEDGAGGSKLAVSHDRQSQATITAPPLEDGVTREGPSMAPEDGAEQKEPVASGTAAVDTVTESSPLTSSSGVLAPPAEVEKSAGDASPAKPGEQSAPAPYPRETRSAGAGIGEEGKAPSSQLRIPLSKFSTQESKSSTGAATQCLPSPITQAPDVDSWRVGESAPPVPEKDNVPDATETSEQSGLDSKGRKLPEPIRTDLDGADHDKRRSVISMLDNDGFMDELQSATVQQATPITVSKSPISPFFPVDPSSKRATIGPDGPRPPFNRTASNPVRSSYLAPGEVPVSAPRSASSSAAYLQKTSQPQTPTDLRPKSTKLGGSIAQRIKALEKLSGSAAPVETAAPKERPATTFFAVRKAGTREPSRPPSVASVADMASSLTMVQTPSPPPSRGSSPDATRVMGRGRAGSLVNRLSMFEGGMPPRGRPESVQVTARIVRDPNQPYPRGPEPKPGSADYGPLELKQSPLVVDVQNRAPSRSGSVRTLEREIAVQAKQSLLERRLSKQSQEDKAESQQGSDGPRPRRRSSLTVVKDFIKGAKSPSTDNLGNTPGLASPAVTAPSRSPTRPPSINQTGSLARRLSISSRRSSTDQNATVLSPARTAEGGADADAETKSNSSSGPASPNQSKGSRASRFMRRLSNTLVTGRKNAAPSISPTVAEENAAEVEAASRGGTATGAAAQSQPTIVAFMGDVNVQFPDNLLWKRRSICLDSQGFLILSAVQGTAMLPTSKDRLGAMVKRYHMSDFKPPYAPDVELQELPNSVVLDLVDGSGLQIACEDRAGQMSILHILEEAHRNHSNFGC